MEDVVLLKITLLTKTRKLTDQNRFNMIQLNMENVVLLQITLLTKTRKFTDTGFNMIQLNMEDVVLLKITLLTKTRKLTDQNRVQHDTTQHGRCSPA